MLVFREKGPVLSALKKGEFPTSLFPRLEVDRLMSFNHSEWSPLLEAKDIVEMARIPGRDGKEDKIMTDLNL